MTTTITLIVLFGLALFAYGQYIARRKKHD